MRLYRFDPTEVSIRFTGFFFSIKSQLSSNLFVPRNKIAFGLQFLGRPFCTLQMNMISFLRSEITDRQLIKNSISFILFS